MYSAITNDMTLRIAGNTAERHPEKIGTNIINKTIDPSVATQGPLLRVNNMAEICMDKVNDHRATIVNVFIFTLG